MRAVAVLVLALGCQGTSGGIRPDAPELDAASEPCSDPGDWSTRSPRLIAPYEGLPGSIAVDDTYVYWTEFLPCPDAFCMAGPIVVRAPLAGGEREVLFESEVDQPREVGVTRDYLFVNIGEQLWRSHKDGSVAEVVGAQRRFVTDPDALYHWREDGTLVRVAADTLEETPIGVAPEGWIDFQLAGRAAWWLDPDRVDIWRMRLDSGTAELATHLQQTSGDSLAVDGLGRAFLAIYEQGDSQSAPFLARIDTDGAEPEWISELWDAVHAVTVDEAYVYWADPGVHRLSRMPPEGGCVESRDLEVAFVGMATTAEGPVVATAGSIALVER